MWRHTILDAVGEKKKGIWDEYREDNWTKILIPNLNPWVNRNHGNVGFHLCQLLSGHGCFQAYLFSIRKNDNPECLYCKQEDDTAEHTFFECSRWHSEKELVETKVGKITKHNIINIMLKSDRNWELTQDFASRILRTKERDERQADS